MFQILEGVFQRRFPMKRDKPDAKLARTIRLDGAIQARTVALAILGSVG